MPSRSAPSGFRNIQIERTNKEEDGIKGWKSKLSWYNYKIVDADSGQPIGLWLEQSGFSLTRGTLRLHVKDQYGKCLLDPDELTYILLAMSGLVDKIRRVLQQRATP